MDASRNVGFRDNNQNIQITIRPALAMRKNNDTVKYKSARWSSTSSNQKATKPQNTNSPKKPPSKKPLEPIKIVR